MGLKSLIDTAVCVAACVLFTGIFLLSYFKSKDRYDEYVEYLNKEEYGLKDFIPMGLWMAEAGWSKKILPYGLQSILGRHKNQVFQLILELHNPKEAEYYAYIHSGYRLCVGIVAAAGASIFGMIMALQGDASTGILLAAVSVGAFFGVPFLLDSSLKEAAEKRRRSIQMEFPEFVNKLVLLINAGMTVSAAWNKIVLENKREHVLYEEMRYAVGEVQAGVPEMAAYERFARRCHVKEVTKFMSLLIMNLRGGPEVVPALKAQGDECWAMRKSAALQIGEEANTKILIPMMIMFFGIVLIVATPAVLSMTQGM